MCLYAGNTCFLNSIIQVLYYTQAFVDSLSILRKDMVATFMDYAQIRKVAVSYSV